MRVIRYCVVMMAAISLAGLFSAAGAQQPYRMSERELKRLLGRIDKGAETFRRSLDKSLDKGRFDGTKAEDNINQFVKDFVDATDTLKSRFDDSRAASGSVEEVLRRAAAIDNFMLRHKLTPRAQNDWRDLRVSLDELARAYNVSWSWMGLTNRPYRISDEQLEVLLARVETSADSFRKSLNDALDKTAFNKTNAEDDVNHFVKEFEHATDHLKKRFNSKESAAADVEEILRRAARIDTFMRQHKLTLRAQDDWAELRRSLDELAQAYNVSWKWVTA
jgi:DNA-binding TFAR19-related protein (PDSD5 family)